MSPPECTNLGTICQVFYFDCCILHNSFARVRFDDPATSICWHFSKSKKLLGMGYSADLKSMQSIGYRHIVDFIEGRLSREEGVRTLKRDTRRFAKRQFTWFGADTQIQWCEPDQVNEIGRLVKKFLE
jgi:hypothetical protein